MLEFLVSFVLILVYVITKTQFLMIEKVFAMSPISVFESCLLIIVFLVGIFFFIRDYRHGNGVKQIAMKFNKGSLILVIFTLSVISLSFWLNFVKKSLDWDAVALYDARAIYLQSGIKFSEMDKLSENDIKNNKYYYSLYPPFTSIIHYDWHKITSAPVSLLYSVFLTFLGVSTFVFSKKYLGVFNSLIMVAIIISSKQIFETSLIEYTNLPFTLYFTVGIFCLYDHINNGKTWNLIFGSILISSTMWIRFSEPIWLAVVCSYLLYLAISKKIRSKLLSVLVLFLLCMTEYVAWSYFVKNIASAPAIFGGSLAMKILEAITGLFSGSFIIVSKHFIISIGVIILVYLIAFLIGISKISKKENDNPNLFLSFVIISSICLYLAILYYLVFQASWWMEIGSSIARSLTFILPICTFLIIQYIGHLIHNNFKETVG